MTTSEPIYQAAGGAQAFERLVERFYAGVAEDPLLRPLYPEDLKPPERRLALFLMQYFGGPQTYSAERGHPRLRMRHFPFVIDRAVRDAWMQHMTEALASTEIPEGPREEIRRYLEEASVFLINRPDE